MYITRCHTSESEMFNGDEVAWKQGLIVGRRIESQGLGPEGNQKAVGLRDKPARSRWRFAKV